MGFAPLPSLNVTSCVFILSKPGLSRYIMEEVRMVPYKAITRRLSIIVLLAVLAAWAALPAAAQSTVPDLSQFGYPQVGGTVNFTPGQATSVSAGNQRVDIPADFLSVPAKFELLTGDPSSFHQFLSP